LEKKKKGIEKEKMISKKEWEELKKKERLLNQSLETLRVEYKDLPRVVKRFLKEIEEMNEKLKKK
jgi:predicted  nucleic acid-binding Zn-ribbon protein